MANSKSSLYLFFNGTLRYPVRRQLIYKNKELLYVRVTISTYLVFLTGNVDCPMKFDSPKISSSNTSNRNKANSGLMTKISIDSFQMGLNPLSAKILEK